MPNSLRTRRDWLRTMAAGALAGWLWRAAEEPVRAADPKPKPDKEKEEEIEMARVPAKVRQAAAKAVGGAKWVAALHITDEHGEFYELEGTDARGRGVVVTVTADGVVDEIETEIRLKDLPEAVSKAVKEKMPRFKATLAFEITEEGKVTRYEIEGRRPKDKEDIALSVSPDGKTIEIDEGDADDKDKTDSKGEKKAKAEAPKDKKGKK